jgi:hypothetical protein
MQITGDFTMSNTLYELEQSAREDLEERCKYVNRESELQDAIAEIADNITPVYYSDIHAIYESDSDKVDDALSDYVDNYGTECLGNKLKSGGLSDLIQLAICWHFDDYLNSVASEVWAAYQEEQEEQEGEV